MPLTIVEANRIFQRQVGRESERVEALQMGAGICEALLQRTQQLEATLKAAGIPIPTVKGQNTMINKDREVESDTTP